jgi:ribosome maturation protein SDO1
MPGKMTISRWIKKEHHNLARLKKAGETFEVSINPDFAIELKKGKNVEVKDCLNSEEIFADVRKGFLASEEKVKEVFGTDDALEIAKKIIKEGEISLTHEYREKIREDKKKKIITTISRNAIDPRTKLPHPAARIEGAIEEAKVIIDEFRPAEEQIEEIVRKLQPIIPIKFEKEEVEVKIPANHAPKAYPVAKQFGKIKKQRWGSDGSWTGTIEVPAGLLQDMIDRLNNITHGGIEIKII